MTRVRADAIRTYNTTTAPALVVILFDGTSYTINTPSSEAAYNAMIKLDSILGNLTDNTSGIIYLSYSDIILTGCLPVSFVANGAVLEITGIGFTSDMNNGLIRLEDISGGVDDNGYSYTIAYESPTQLTATYAATGDGVIGGAFESMIYYKSAAGVYSNGVIVNAS